MSLGHHLWAALDGEHLKNTYVFMFSITETPDGLQITQMKEFMGSLFASTFYPRLFAVEEEKSDLDAPRCGSQAAVRRLKARESRDLPTPPASLTTTGRTSIPRPPRTLVFSHPLTPAARGQLLPKLKPASQSEQARCGAVGRSAALTHRPAPKPRSSP
jgi:hypothetical protein